MRNTARALFFVSVLLCLQYVVKGQSYPGYRTSNYSGVNGIFFNPANIAHSRYKWDINVLAVDAYAGNNQTAMGFKDITQSFAAGRQCNRRVEVIIRNVNQTQEQNVIKAKP